MASLSALTNEYLETVVTASVSPSGTIEFAFPVQSAAPVAGDWEAGAWLAAATTNSDGTFSRRARTGLIGSDHVLAVGRYDAWFRVTEAPEIPTHKFDKLTVF